MHFARPAGFEMIEQSGYPVDWWVDQEALPWFADGELCLGVWQKIVCIDFDDRPRQRRLVFQVLGV